MLVPISAHELRSPRLGVLTFFSIAVDSRRSVPIQLWRKWIWRPMVLIRAVPPWVTNQRLSMKQWILVHCNLHLISPIGFDPSGNVAMYFCNKVFVYVAHVS